MLKIVYLKHEIYYNRILDLCVDVAVQVFRQTCVLRLAATSLDSDGSRLEVVEMEDRRQTSSPQVPARSRMTAGARQDGPRLDAAARRLVPVTADRPLRRAVCQ